MNLGVAPAVTIAETVGTAVLATVITSSPGPMPKVLSAIKIASVPLFTPTPCRACEY